MKKPILYISALIYIICLFFCKTQYQLKHRLYLEVIGIDNRIDTLVIRHYSRHNSLAIKLNDSLRIRLDSLDSKSMKIRDSKLRKDLRLYTTTGKKLIALHEDIHMNTEALGPLLNAYTRALAGIKEQLTAHR